MTRPPYQEYAWQLAANDSRRKKRRDGDVDCYQKVGLHTNQMV